MTDTEREAYDLLIKMTRDGIAMWKVRNGAYKCEHNNATWVIYHDDGNASHTVMNIGSVQVMAIRDSSELYDLVRSRITQQRIGLLSEWVESTTKLISKAKL